MALAPGLLVEVRMLTVDGTPLDNLDVSVYAGGWLRGDCGNDKKHETFWLTLPADCDPSRIILSAKGGIENGSVGELWVADPVSLETFVRAGDRYYGQIVLHRKEEVGAALWVQGIYEDGSPAKVWVICHPESPGPQAGKAFCAAYNPKIYPDYLKLMGLVSGQRYVVEAKCNDAYLEKPVQACPGMRLQLILKRGEAVEGRVVDAKGAPVPGACLSVEGDDGFSPLGGCDDQGKFKIQGFRPGARICVSACPSGMTEWSLSGGTRFTEKGEVEVPACGWKGVPAGTRDLVITLTPEGGVREYSP